MWPRWSKISARGVIAGGGGGNGSGSGSPNLNPSFTFDLRYLVHDENEASSANAPSSVPPSIVMRRAAVFHRVRVASAALRAWRSLPSSPTAASPSPAEEKRIVLYYTSLRVIRPIFEECCAVRSILRGFRVAIDERDLSMDSGFIAELKQILGKKQLSLPRVFIGGRYIGGFDEIQKLNETGELKKFVEGVPPAAAGVCEACGGMRFVLCGTCSGSRKYYSEKSGFMSCKACNENGLLRCPDCCCGASD